MIRELGVSVHTHTRVTGIKLSSTGEVMEVQTENGSIKTEHVVNATGLWGPRLAAMAGLLCPPHRSITSILLSRLCPGTSSRTPPLACETPITWYICVKRPAG